MDLSRRNLQARQKKNRERKTPTPKNASSEFMYKQTQISSSKMAFLRSIATTATAISTLAFSSSFSHSHQSPNTALSSTPKSNKPLSLVKTFATSPSPLLMDQNSQVP